MLRKFLKFVHIDDQLVGEWARLLSNFTYFHAICGRVEKICS